ncbi:hypothetical protein Q5752_003502 [Cryptotrichosporon argae]
MTQSLFYQNQMQGDLFFDQPAASGSGTKPKRKRAASAECEDPGVKCVRHAPHFDRRTTFPLHQRVPDLIDHTSSGSEATDTDADIDMDGPMPMPMSASGPAPAYSQSSPIRPSFECSGGSGGFAFGPGAEEDMSDDEPSWSMVANGTYPSLIAHTNPHHFSNLPSVHATTPAYGSSPWHAQPYATTLPAPAPASNGLMQPAPAVQLPFGASDVDRARNTHGPHCPGIPKLTLSDYPDPATGQRSMWTTCPSCGACERAQ